MEQLHSILTEGKAGPFDEQAYMRALVNKERRKINREIFQMVHKVSDEVF